MKLYGKVGEGDRRYSTRLPRGEEGKVVGVCLSKIGCSVGEEKYSSGFSFASLPKKSRNQWIVCKVQNSVFLQSKLYK